MRRLPKPDVSGSSSFSFVSRVLSNDEGASIVPPTLSNIETISLLFGTHFLPNKIRSCKYFHKAILLLSFESEECHKSWKLTPSIRYNTLLSNKQGSFLAIDNKCSFALVIKYFTYKSFLLSLPSRRER